MRNFMILLFTVDCIVSALFVLGFYYKMENWRRQYYMQYGQYVILDCFCLFVMSVFFTLSVFLKLKKTINGFLISFVFLIAIDFAIIKIIQAFWVSNPMNTYQLMMIWLYHIFIAFYLQINSYLILAKRQKKFYSHESIRCFYTYYTDIFSFFWIDIFKVI